jgi:hypothetical protein
VRAGSGTRTLAYAAPFYDEDGVYHDHDPNVSSSTLTCSNGHKWAESSKSPCPAPGCDYGKAASGG